MAINRFFYISLLFHLILLGLIPMLDYGPVEKKEISVPVFARILGPEEFPEPALFKPAMRKGDALKMPGTLEKPPAPQWNPPVKDSVPGAYIAAREKLFDMEVIGELAKKAGPQKPGTTIAFDTKEFGYYGYMQSLKAKIEGIWVYPPGAAEKGIYGDLHVRFYIEKDGRLSAVELLRTSGFGMLDEAALKALRDAEPFWPLPETWGKEGLEITGHFVYSIYGAYLR